METKLIERILSDSASFIERETFNIWLKESESNRVYFEQMKVLWEKSKSIQGTVHFDEDIARDAIRTKINKKRIAVAKARTLKIWISAAASIIILLGISTIVLNQSGLLFQKTVEYTTQNQVQQVVLPDSSVVWLNANSKLTVPEKFSTNQRNVKLLGEAYFEIKRDEFRPFKVHTGKTITKVLGTSFNIKMDEKTGSISVIVNSGKVAFFRPFQEKEGVILHVGDKAEFLANTQTIQKVKNQNVNYLAWKTNILIFQNTPLKEVCKVIGGYYQRDVVTSLSDGNYVITGRFENENIENILSTIELVLDVKVAQKNNRIIIYK